ncbi:hypothetical protein FB567DRAFT_552088 [Paraphoma chrysanthemicola]|uniref:Uncharacterized protein n=1 Tax=Paraphoma chrysanthemicola TaxID=798071 RepID=A0A8K0R1L4_9PLEO|nr:hypothetical protein FB567DRAFT_552088 [Paraphoma chrysanthemicola]
MLLKSFMLQSLVLGSISAYKIDQSCIRKGMETDIRNAMQSAFQMVDAARARLDANPLHQDTVDLLQYLFASPGQDPRTLDMEKTKKVLQQVKETYETEVLQNEAPNIKDVIKLET